MDMDCGIAFGLLAASSNGLYAPRVVYCSFYIHTSFFTSWDGGLVGGMSWPVSLVCGPWMQSFRYPIDPPRNQVAWVGRLGLLAVKTEESLLEKALWLFTRLH